MRTAAAAVKFNDARDITPSPEQVAFNPGADVASQGIAFWTPILYGGAVFFLSEYFLMSKQSRFLFARRWMTSRA